MFGRTLIFSGGKTDIEFARIFVEDNEFDTVVCADSGLNIAYTLNVKVDYIMGDFDSVSPDVLNYYKTRQMEGQIDAQFVKYPTAKDYTDTQMVLDFVLEHKPHEIYIMGATGGRLDHFFANVHALIEPMKSGVPTYIVDSNNRLYLIDRPTAIDKTMLWGKYISFQPLTERVTNVTLKGFKYLLDGYELTMGRSRAISNEMADDENKAIVSFDKGVLIVIESRD